MSLEQVLWNTRLERDVALARVAELEAGNGYRAGMLRAVQIIEGVYRARWKPTMHAGNFVKDVTTMIEGEATGHAVDLEEAADGD